MKVNILKSKFSSNFAKDKGATFVSNSAFNLVENSYLNNICKELINKGTLPDYLLY